MVTLKFSDADARTLLDAVQHACDDLYATLQDESGRDDEADAIRLRRWDNWERVSAGLAKQLKEAR